MTEHKILYLPLDERPCNYLFPQEIAAETPIEVLVPQQSLLGDKKSAANFDGLKAFLLANAAFAERCVVSLDMLLYGGIVPSRLHELPIGELRLRLDVLKELKKLNPKLKIYAFALIMRCPSYSSDDEEPSYYADCGKEIFLLGQLKHKAKLGLLSKREADELAKEYVGKIGEKNLADYENRRLTNREMLCEIVSRLGAEIDFLAIPQDDSAPYGYTAMDREYLFDKVGDKLKNAAMFPGADEVGMTLLARAACECEKRFPKVFCVFATEKSKDLIPLYEDRPLKVTLPAQLENCSAKPTQNEAEADIYLFLNYPSKAPVEVWQDDSCGYTERNLPLFCAKIRDGLQKNKIVAIADGAYANGGDAAMLKMLSEQANLMDVSSYAGWNTSSNSLGTALAQAVFVWLFGKTYAQNLFLAKRYFEDVGYCGYIRRYVTERLSERFDYFNVGEADGEVASQVRIVLQSYMEKNFSQVGKNYRAVGCRMPWKRMFEVDLTVEKI